MKDLSREGWTHMRVDSKTKKVLQKASKLKGVTLAHFMAQLRDLLFVGLDLEHAEVEDLKPYYGKFELFVVANPHVLESEKA